MEREPVLQAQTINSPIAFPVSLHLGLGNGLRQHCMSAVNVFSLDLISEIRPWMEEGQEELSSSC